MSLSMWSSICRGLTQNLQLLWAFGFITTTVVKKRKNTDAGPYEEQVTISVFSSLPPEKNRSSKSAAAGGLKDNRPGEVWLVSSD